MITLETIRYVTNDAGERTEVLVPVATWEALLSVLEQIIDHLDDEEDLTILQEWLAKRATGQLKMISIDELEGELLADGFLPNINKLATEKQSGPEFLLSLAGKFDSGTTDSSDNVKSIVSDFILRKYRKSEFDLVS